MDSDFDITQYNPSTDFDITQYASNTSRPYGSAMILVDAVYFQRLDLKYSRVNHRLSLLFFHKRAFKNAQESMWDKWARILYMTPSYNETVTEFSKVIHALTGQEIKGHFNDDVLAKMGRDLVKFIKNNDFVFNVEWVKKKYVYYINRINKSSYVMERPAPAIIEWPKQLLAAYPEIEDARPSIKD